jgi:hypothetical protein
MLSTHGMEVVTTARSLATCRKIRRSPLIIIAGVVAKFTGTVPRLIFGLRSESPILPNTDWVAAGLRGATPYPNHSTGIEAPFQRLRIFRHIELPPRRRSGESHHRANSPPPRFRVVQLLEDYRLKNFTREGTRRHPQTLPGSSGGRGERRIFATRTRRISSAYASA